MLFNSELPHPSLLTWTHSTLQTWSLAIVSGGKVNTGHHAYPRFRGTWLESETYSLYSCRLSFLSPCLITTSFLPFLHYPTRIFCALFIRVSLSPEAIAMLGSATPPSVFCFISVMLLTSLPSGWLYSTT